MSIELNISRHFNADVESVYKAWVEPDRLCKWMGPGSVRCIKFESDLHIGGHYEIHMQTDEGIKIAYGEYRVIETNKKLSFTWGWRDSELQDSLVSLTFSESESGTELVLEHSNFPTTEVMEHHNLGWNGCLEKLEHYFDS